MLPYDAAKSGLNTLTEGFAQAFGPSVRVNCIMAGPFLTDISKAWGPDVRGRACRTTRWVGPASPMRSWAPPCTSPATLVVVHHGRHPAC